MIQAAEDELDRGRTDALERELRLGTVARLRRVDRLAEGATQMDDVVDIARSASTFVERA